MATTATFTEKHLERLKAPFENTDVKQLKTNWGVMNYLDEEPIANRIEEVDPAWILGEPIVIEDTASHVSIKVSVTIKGVTRWGVGTEKKNEGNEPFKSAATDAFKRAARLFGVGRYLLSGGKGNTSQSSSRKSSSQKPKSQSSHEKKEANRRVAVYEGVSDLFGSLNDMMAWAGKNNVNWDNSSQEIIAYINKSFASLEAI
jgi:hypothetical protein